jgi:hypothetical protein
MAGGILPGDAFRRVMPAPPRALINGINATPRLPSGRALKGPKTGPRGVAGGATVFEMVNGFELFSPIFRLPSTFPKAWPLTPGLVVNGPSTSPSEYETVALVALEPASLSL